MAMCCWWTAAGLQADPNQSKSLWGGCVAAAPMAEKRNINTLQNRKKG